MSYKTGRGNVTKKGLRFHAAVKMVFDYQSVTKHTVAASRQLAPEVIMVMYMSPTAAAFAVTWRKRGMKMEWKSVEEMESRGREGRDPETCRVE